MLASNGKLRNERKSENRERDGLGDDGGGRLSRAHGRALARVVIPVRRIAHRVRKLPKGNRKIESGMALGMMEKVTMPQEEAAYPVPMAASSSPFDVLRNV